MNLTLSDEQTMLRESAERFVRDWTSAADADPSTLWGTFADLGWLALPLPEEQGGLGGSILDATLLTEAFGRGLLVTPYIGTAILCAGLIEALGTGEQHAAILPSIAVGAHKLSFAHSEAGPRGGERPLATDAIPHKGGWRLNGTKVAVVDAEGADTIIVSARSANGVGLFLVPCGTPGVSIVGYPMTGGGSAGTVTLDDVILPASACLAGGDVGAAIESAMDSAITVHCAETVGMMTALLDATVAYTNTREQFGKALTANQNVRFRLADMAVALEEARSLTLRAALMIATPAARRIRAVAGAKAGVARAARRVAELAIQLHGAMGVTEELTIGIYYKRILAFDALYGGVDFQLVRHARASGRLTASREAA